MVAFPFSIHVVQFNPSPSSLVIWTSRLGSWFSVHRQPSSVASARLLGYPLPSLFLPSTLSVWNLVNLPCLVMLLACISLAFPTLRCLFFLPLTVLIQQHEPSPCACVLLLGYHLSATSESCSWSFPLPSRACLQLRCGDCVSCLGACSRALRFPLPDERALLPRYEHCLRTLPCLLGISFLGSCWSVSGITAVYYHSLSLLLFLKFLF